MSSQLHTPPIEQPAPAKAWEHALEMTVHQLPSAAPSPAEQPGVDPALVRAGRLRMLLVLLICAAPVLASYFIYYVVRPEGRRNYGELVAQTPMPQNMAAIRVDGRLGELAQLRRQWLLVSVAGGACAALCEKHLYLQRQMREGLGRDKDRLDWVWLVNDDVPLAPALAATVANLEASQGARVLRVNAAQLAAWLKPAAGQSIESHLYVVDPMGNHMMRFPAALDVPKASRDLGQLMRGSKSWDEAGRPEQPSSEKTSPEAKP